MATNGSAPSSFEGTSSKPIMPSIDQHDNNKRTGPIMVQPPKREDLQPSYAQTLQGESDSGSHGWYGSMSKFTSNLSLRDASQAYKI